MRESQKNGGNGLGLVRAVRHFDFIRTIYPRACRISRNLLLDAHLPSRPRSPFPYAIITKRYRVKKDAENLQPSKLQLKPARRTSQNTRYHRNSCRKQHARPSRETIKKLSYDCMMRSGLRTIRGRNRNVERVKI